MQINVIETTNAVKATMFEKELEMNM